MKPPIGQSLPRTLSSELRPAMLSLAVGALLMGGKFVAYYITRSSAIFSDAMENVVNVLSSGFAVYAILLAHRPADLDHPYGHGKVEFLSAGFEGGMMLLASLVIIGQAIGTLLSGQTPTDLTLGFAVAATSMILCTATAMVLRRRGIASGSIALQADGVHLLGDALTSGMVIVGLLIFRQTHFAWADPLAALAISFFIIRQAAVLMRRSAAGLMDEQDRDDAELLKRILDAHIGPRGKPPWICSYHELRHRHSGRYHWVDFHIQVPAWWDVQRGHHVASEIEGEIERALGNGDATAHVEPCVRDGCSSCQQDNLSTKLTKEHEEF